MRKRNRLSEVRNRQGRIDVMLYRLADHGLGRLEQEQGLLGLRENLLPILESFITPNVQAENLIPQEIQAVLKICQLNRDRKALADGHQ